MGHNQRPNLRDSRFLSVGKPRFDAIAEVSNEWSPTSTPLISLRVVAWCKFLSAFYIRVSPAMNVIRRII
jgi:hypothetical protein